MRLLIAFKNLLILFLAVAIFSTAAWAKETSLPPHPANFKMAFEVELLPTKLANLMPLFDFEAVQAQVEKFGPEATTKLVSFADNKYRAAHPGEPDLTKSYLRDNPKALAALPADLRAELTQGLSLQNRVLTESTPLLGADGNSIKRDSKLILSTNPVPSSMEKPKLILPGSSLALPTAVAEKNSLSQKTGSLELPNRMDWETLYARWEKLPAYRRAGAVRLELMNPLAKASVFSVVSDLPYHILKTRDISLPLKADVAEKDRDLFARLEWEPDGDAIEFRHKGTVASPDAFFADIQHFSRRAGVEREIFDPEAARMAGYVKDAEGNIRNAAKSWGSFHYHYSMGKELDEYAEALNLNLLVRRLQAGITSDLNGGDFGFSPVGFKGLMRLHDGGRMEIRSHGEPLREEVHRQLSALFLMDSAAAAKEVAADTSARLTDEIILKVAASEQPLVLKNLGVIKRPDLIPMFEKWLREPKHTFDAMKAILQFDAKNRALEAVIANYWKSGRFGELADKIPAKLMSKWLLNNPGSMADAIGAKFPQLVQRANIQLAKWDSCSADFAIISGNH